MPIFKKAVMAGIGLIGGSLAIAGKKAGLFERVVALGRTQATLDEALKLGIVDEVSLNPKDALLGADLLFVSVPVENIAPLVISLSKYLEDGCVVTDGGSVKGAIVSELDKKLPESVRFVGGHPVAGTEKSGPSAAFETLYDGKYTILTPTEKTDKEALSLVKNMWEGVSSKVVSMTPTEHDKALAVISHLPHLAAYSLVETLGDADRKGGDMQRFAAGGFKDITRIAQSNPEMWCDIFEMNKDEVLKSLDLFEKSVKSFREVIEKNDFSKLREKLENVRTLRLGIEKKR